MLTQQPKGQLQNEDEWKKETDIHKVQNKAMYNILEMTIIIK
jgi:hypothetical protein